jgi:hypothetical protein
MAIASFDEEQKLIRQTSSLPTEALRGMSGWLVRTGLAANQTSADLTLVVGAGLAIAIAILAPFVLGASHTKDSSDPEVRAAIHLFSPQP